MNFLADQSGRKGSLPRFVSLWGLHSEGMLDIKDTADNEIVNELFTAKWLVTESGGAVS